jgi:dipeptidyl aminopeptidase/acylaminoacyl peptidase
MQGYFANNSFSWSNLMRRRTLVILILVILLVVLPVGGYLAASTVVYNQLTSVKANCSDRADELDNTPAVFNLPHNLDSTPYLMRAFEEVRLQSRDPHITVAGWYIPAAGNPDSAPSVILVHGLNTCRRSPTILLPAGMLYRNGFNTLLIDIRDHGDSTVEDGRYAGGTEEYRDALGAWDWLVSDKGVAPERIGLLGTSLGAATVMIAGGEEPRVAAVWEDSGYADLSDAVSAELARNGFPQFIAAGGLFMGRLIAGDDVTAYSPVAGVRKMGTRPIYITHGAADTRLSVDYAYDLADAIRAQGGNVEPWIIEGAEHVQGMFLQPEAYEQRLIEFFTRHLGA